VIARPDPGLWEGGPPLRTALLFSAARTGFARARPRRLWVHTNPAEVVMVPRSGTGLPTERAGRRGSSEDDLPLRVAALRTVATDGV